MVITWEAPESAKRGRAASKKWPAIAAELAERPGEWAVVAENLSASMTTYLKNKFGLEVVARGRGEKGRAEKIYARFPAA